MDLASLCSLSPVNGKQIPTKDAPMETAGASRDSQFDNGLSFALLAKSSQREADPDENRRDSQFDNGLSFALLAKSSQPATQSGGSNWKKTALPTELNRAAELALLGHLISQ